MSYNIDTWNTKELANFKIPIEAIHAKGLDVLLLPSGDSDDQKISISGGAEDMGIEGILNNNIISVAVIHCSGEGSGRFWEHFQDILKHSTGKLISTQVWEGEGTIGRLTAIEGEVCESYIEI